MYRKSNELVPHDGTEALDGSGNLVMSRSQSHPLPLDW